MPTTANSSCSESSFLTRKNLQRSGSVSTLNPLLESVLTIQEGQSSRVQSHPTIEYARRGFSLHIPHSMRNIGS